MDGRITELTTERDLIRNRRLSEETLYAAEFGEPPTDPERPSRLRDQMRAATSPGPLTGSPWADAIAAVLRDARQPLHVREIWKRLVEGGFQTEARDPIRSIVSIAVRDTRFAKAGANRYALVAPTGQGEVSAAR